MDSLRLKYLVYLVSLTLVGIAFDDIFMSCKSGSAFGFPYQNSVYLEFNKLDKSEKENKNIVEEDKEEESSINNAIAFFAALPYKNTHTEAHFESHPYTSRQKKPPKA